MPLPAPHPRPLGAAGHPLSLSKSKRSLSADGPRGIPPIGITRGAMLPGLNARGPLGGCRIVCEGLRFVGAGGADGTAMLKERGCVGGVCARGRKAEGLEVAIDALVGISPSSVEN